MEKRRKISDVWCVVQLNQSKLNQMVVFMPLVQFVWVGLKVLRALQRKTANKTMVSIKGVVLNCLLGSGAVQS